MYNGRAPAAILPTSGPPTPGWSQLPLSKEHYENVEALEPPYIAGGMSNGAATFMFIPALFVIAKKKPPKDLSAEGWINKWGISIERNITWKKKRKKYNTGACYNMDEP